MVKIDDPVVLIELTGETSSVENFVFAIRRAMINVSDAKGVAPGRAIR